MAHGGMTHIEFPADDIDRAKRFYEAVAGWEFAEMEGMPGYWVFRSGPEAGGGLGKRGDTVGSVVRVYINVDDIGAALAKAKATGGSIVTPATEIPGLGHFAAVQDPEGNEVGLYQAAAG